MEKVFKALRDVFYSAPGRGAISSALLFSSFFSLFSSLPTLSAYITEGRLKGTAAVMFGALFSLLIGGTWACLIYAIVVASASIIIGELIRSEKSFGSVFAASSLSIIAVYFLVFLIYAATRSTSLMESLIYIVGYGVDVLSTNYPQIIEQQLMQTGMSKKELITATAIQLPSIIGVAIIAFVFINVMMSARSSKSISKFLKKEHLKKVRLPERMVWLAIIAGAFYLYSISDYNTSIGVKTMGIFFFRTLAVVYFLQGLIIINLFFTSMLGGGLLSVLLFSVMVVFAYMFVAAIGFFDLWFDFRKYIKKGEQQL